MELILATALTLSLTVSSPQATISIAGMLLKIIIIMFKERGVIDENEILIQEVLLGKQFHRGLVTNKSPPKSVIT